jgi:hypothetical protein
LDVMVEAWPLASIVGRDRRAVVLAKVLGKP